MKTLYIITTLLIIILIAAQTISAGKRIIDARQAQLISIGVN